MDEGIEELNKKIEAFLSLLIIDKDLKLNEKIGFLNRFGLSNKSISRILGISENHVSKEKSIGKKKNG